MVVINRNLNAYKFNVWENVIHILVHLDKEFGNDDAKEILNMKNIKESEEWIYDNAGNEPERINEKRICTEAKVN